MHIYIYESTSVYVVSFFTQIRHTIKSFELCSFPLYLEDFFKSLCEEKFIQIKVRLREDKFISHR